MRAATPVEGVLWRKRVIFAFLSAGVFVGLYLPSLNPQLTAPQPLFSFRSDSGANVMDP